MENLLTELINATLSRRSLDEKVVKGTSDNDWERTFETALHQQVLAMTFTAMSALPKEQRPNFTLWSKWMAYAQNTAAQSRQKREVVRKLGEWLAADGLSTMIIKGFSLAVLYPQPELRESGDIDIYSCEDYDAVNACFEKHGLQIGRADGHHVNINVDGISVEHHFALRNSRVKNGMKGSTEVLQLLASTNRRPTSLPGICFPSPTFTALFTAWHAHKHFLTEKIELRHVIDWVLSLRRLSDTEAQTVSEVKCGSPWGRFADTLTAIALHRLQLPTDWFPQQELESSSEISSELEQRVWDDILCSGHTAHARTSNPRRLNIARRTLQNRWKFNIYADISAERFLWKEFVGFARSRLQEKHR